MIKLHHKSDEVNIDIEVKSVSCTDVLRSVYYFLLAVSFHKDVIINSLRAILEELDDEGKE